ncbi:hypothetical protein [Mycobacterium sp. IS-1264]|uniref:hypothetical protein n=1 Tax=Mycobacterium sp. IS-1264 TaxID=1834158 RepID=UPI001F0A1F1E|nr:hypothetical protein [Mycobacterium sp. IS-1264]
MSVIRLRGPSAIRTVRIALRLSLAAAFLSAVADRFGWWKTLGQGSWGSMRAFAGYAHQLVPFASGWLLTAIVWAATAAEATLGILLLAGWRPKLVGAATCLLLIVFGTAMAISLGMESPLSYSVFSAASAAAAYAILGTTSRPPHTTETTPHRPLIEFANSKHADWRCCRPTLPIIGSNR